MMMSFFEDVFHNLWSIYRLFVESSCFAPIQRQNLKTSLAFERLILSPLNMGQSAYKEKLRTNGYHKL